jgi:cytidylate kinase
VAKALSKKLNILYLDTGAMYRACALKAHRLGIDCKDLTSVDGFIDSVNIEVKYQNGSQITMLDGEDVSEKIRENVISLKASAISAHMSVRKKLVELQRQIASSTDCVLDGRDIGTNVLPNAKYKFYVTASIDVRTERRYNELILKGQTVDKEALREEIALRDYNDSHREFAPLRQAEDAVLVDTSNMTIEEVLNFILQKLEK